MIWIQFQVWNFLSLITASVLNPFGQIYGNKFNNVMAFISFVLSLSLSLSVSDHFLLSPSSYFSFSVFLFLIFPRILYSLIISLWIVSNIFRNCIYSPFPSLSYSFLPFPPFLITKIPRNFQIGQFSIGNKTFAKCIVFIWRRSSC